MDSEIQQFYRNKCVFLTGGTGFMGLGFLEKLLRATEVRLVYLIVRPKKGKTMEERVEDLFKKAIFDVVKKSQPDVQKRVVALFGDCALPNLGLSSNDRQILIDEVQVVMHCAATVRFDDPLYKAVLINVRATLDLLKLAKQMTKLEAFVHVSSAYANCLDPQIDEKFYVKKLGISAVEMCQMVQTLGPERTNQLKDLFWKPYPNTYTLTKALAEEAIMSEGCTLPTCIFRPAIVIQTYKEPISGWVGNFYGPSTILYGGARGVMRVLLINKDLYAQVVPSDYCSNLMVAAPWGINQIRKQNPSTSVTPTIFNYLTDEENPVKWAQYIGIVQKYGYTMPLSNALWYPFTQMTNNLWIYYILWFVYHTVPGYIIDFLLLLKGKRIRMTKLYRKVNKQVVVLHHFLSTEFQFSMDNTKKLWHSMTAKDQQIFNFDMRTVDWDDLCLRSLKGVRLYIAHESPETVPKGLKRMKRFLILHRTVEAIVCGTLCLLLWIFVKMLF